ncbi:MAG: FAD-dependent oxidoreductase, partial [Bacteroidales bacterium]|nr:FAD-dependent oxidoreductase [Bacteroidales bacterium]
MRSAGIFILLSILFISCNKNLTTEIFIEAESFQNKGGWLVDPQFIEQMGSPYLLAHGLGHPIKNARTTLNYQVNGNYYIWVRTKNWAPGNWEAPGKFKLLINGQLTDSILGIRGDWNWQFAGKLNLKSNSVQIELKDITGFEGRCDAIYLSIENKPPPDKPEELAIWRKNILKEENIPSYTEEFDVIVVGGGIAGCAASIAAAEQGLKVALVHDRPVPGGNASSEIRVHTEGITWHSERILKMINTKHWPNGSPEAKQDDKKRLNTLKRYSNISLFFNWRAYT